MLIFLQKNVQHKKLFKIKFLKSSQLIKINQKEEYFMYNF